MNIIVSEAIESVIKSKTSFCKFISANDAGKTGANQAGFYIPKKAVSLIFDTPRDRGINDDRFIKIRWQNDFETDSRFIYYGQKSRNEYRLTRFGKGFPFLSADHVGDLFILSHVEQDFYEGFILEKDEDIEDFFLAFNITSSDTNKLIDKSNFVRSADKIMNCFRAYLNTLVTEFPISADLAKNARICYNRSYSVSDADVLKKPDEILIKWLTAEYDLFRTIENDRYALRIQTPFKSVEELIDYANTILNRRKSRAGKSLEHHLAEIFLKAELKFGIQVVTEENKRPDFIFPGKINYHDLTFDASSLVFLAAKTTCKDRWRQVLNEADRIPEKHLFTLQQGISVNQLEEMKKYKVRLVVPKSYVTCFPETHRNQLLSLNQFLDFVKTKQA